MKPSEVREGMMVRVPEDRGEPSYIGRVINHRQDQPSHTIAGEEYIWVMVLHPKGTKHVWPSNRLGRYT